MTDVYSAERIAEAERLIKAANNILIIAHRSPDGDAIGSSLGLYNALKVRGKQAEVWMPDAFTSNMNWMPGADKIGIYEGNEKEGNEAIKSADLVFCLDFNTMGRTAGMAQLLRESEAPKILIDHHLNPDDDFTVTFSDVPASSTCEMIYVFLTKLGREADITQDVASCLYVGLVTDTGSFKYAANKNTHLAAAAIMELGVDTTAIHSNLFDVNTGDRLKLLGHALSEKMEHYPEHKAAMIALSADDLSRFNYKKGYTDGLVNWGLSIQGVEMAILASEKDGCMKISFRSKGDLDVNVMAREAFGGGGHKNAAGARSDDGYDKTVEKLREIIKKNA